jgi:O-antigen ligase/tetratricopeptide (TPR) repeat protein
MKPRLIRLLDLGVEVLLAALLLYLPAAYGTTTPPYEMVAMCMGGAMAACLAVRIVLAPPRLPPLASGAVLLFLLVATLQLIPLPRAIVHAISPSTADTRTELLGDLPDATATLDRMTISFYPLTTQHDLRIVLLATIVLAAVLVVFRDDPRRTRRLLATIALVGAALALLALAQDITGTSKMYWLYDIGLPARSGPFINHSHFGQFMNLAIGCALGLLLVQLSESNDDTSPRRKWLRVTALAAVIVLGLLTICLSLTRGGVIAMLIAGGFALLVLLSRERLRWLVPVLIGIALAVLVALMYYGFDRVYERMADPRGLHGRLQMIHDTHDIIRRFPVLGTGLGSFEWVYPAYNHTNEANTAGYLENEYIQIAADLGLCGLALVLLFVASVWRSYARTIRAGGIGVAAIGLGYGLAAVMIHSLSDFGQHLASVACLSAAVCGLILNLGGRRSARPIHSVASMGLAAVLLLSAGWMIIGARTACRGDALWAAAQQLARPLERNDWDGTAQQYADLLAAADAAVAAEPDHAHRRYWTAFYHWRDIARERDPKTGGTAKNDRTLAAAQRVVDMLNEARKRCPVDAAIYGVLGQVEYNFLGRAIGVTHLHTAARLDRCDPTLWQVSGEADARRGQWETAETSLRRAADLDASTMDDVITLSLDELHRPQLAERVAEPQYYRVMQVAMAMQKRPAYADQWPRVYDRAVDLLEQVCEGGNAQAWQFAALASYRGAQKQYEKAEKYLAIALQMDSSVLSWRLDHARALAMLGRFDDAIREARTAQHLYPAAKEVQVTIDWLMEKSRL